MNKIETKTEDKQLASGQSVAVSADVAGAKDKKSDEKLASNKVVESETAIKSDKTLKASALDSKAAKDAKDADSKDADVKADKDAKSADLKDAKAVEKDAKAAADDEKAAKVAEAAKKVSAKKEEEPAPVEPTSIFIDHGAILPEYLPGTCLYALVRDPGTLFVYWNATFESNNGWLLTAYDALGNELQSFRTPARRNGRGYFRVPTASVARVTLSIVNDGGSSEVKLESKIRIAEQLGIVQPRPAFDERWVDFENREVIYEAPAPGRAPESTEVYESMKAPGVTAGAIDRSEDGGIDVADYLAAGVCSLSSRFGKLSGPGSSDLLVSSGCLVRR